MRTHEIRVAERNCGNIGEGQVIYRAERTECRRFPRLGDDELAPGLSRNFEIFDPLDFIAEITQHPPSSIGLRRTSIPGGLPAEASQAKAGSATGREVTGPRWLRHSPLPPARCRCR